MKRFISLAVTFALVMTMIIAPATSVYAAGNNNAGFGVMLNGESVIFDSGIGYPQNVNGRIMVPYRGFLLAMGANDEDITYDIQTKTVKAIIDGTKISFKVGGNIIDIVHADGTVATETMDVVPYIDSNVDRTYVSTRFISQAFGCGVGWDAEKATAVVIDWETLLDSLGNGIDNDFSIMGKMITETESIDMEKVYKSVTNIVVEAAVAAELAHQMGLETDQGYSASMEIGMDALVQGMDMDGTITMTIDAEEMIALLDDQAKADAEAALAQLDNSEIAIKFNGETGETYIQSELIDLFVGTAVAGTWYSMNIYDLYEEMGIDLKGLMENTADTEGMTLSDVVVLTIEQMDVYSVDTYKNAGYIYNVMNDLVGDGAFTKEIVSGTTKYKTSITNDKILTALTNHIGELQGVSVADIADLKDEFAGTDINADIQIMEKNGMITRNDLVCTVSAGGMYVTMDMSETASASNGTITMKVDGNYEIKIAISSSMVETSDKVDVSLPANATVVDITKLVSPN